MSEHELRAMPNYAVLAEPYDDYHIRFAKRETQRADALEDRLRLAVELLRFIASPPVVQPDEYWIKEVKRLLASLPPEMQR